MAMYGQMRADVLLVDDNEDFAKVYAETLQIQCQTIVLYATTAKDAIEIVKNNPIKVVILDQVMPTKGTDLFFLLKDIDANLKTILLTAEADRHELTEATNIGFDYALLKETRDMEQLPSMILLLTMKYNADMASAASTPFYTQEYKSLFGKTQQVEYSVIGYKTIDDTYVDPNNWLTRNLIERGTTLSFEEEINVEEEFCYTKDFSINNEQGLGIELKQLMDFKTQLSLKMETDFHSTYTESLKKVINRKAQFEIKDESAGIVSRAYEYAKVFQKIKVFLRKTCSCCSSKTIESVTVCLPIPIVKYRIREYYDDGSDKELISGEIRGN